MKTWRPLDTPPMTAAENRALDGSPPTAGSPSGNIMSSLDDRLKRAREISWERFGKRITFFLPGMFSYHGLSGKYPAISITGDRCVLRCDHCRGKILESMIAVAVGEELIAQCIRLKEKGNHGVLISGGCDGAGRLPWDAFFDAIKEAKERTGLYISVHSGLVDDHTAFRLKEAGVDQALLDVVGDDETYRKVYHVDFGVSRIRSSLEALQRAGLSVVPHIVCGLDYGRIIGEKEAIRLISRFEPDQVVMVSLMRIPGTPAWHARSIGAEEVAELIAEARFRLPSVKMSLGCARQRGDTRLEILSVDAGINRMALPSEEAVRRAMDYGLEIRYQRTCCSVSEDFSEENWVSIP